MPRVYIVIVTPNEYDSCAVIVGVYASEVEARLRIDQGRPVFTRGPRKGQPRDPKDESWRQDWRIETHDVGTGTLAEKVSPC